MAQPRRKGKSKQKAKKPVKIVEAEAKPVENAEVAAEIVETETTPASEPVVDEKQLKKQAKEKAKQDKKIAKEKADKKRQEARERAGKETFKQKIKGTASELKKVSWPSFRETMKKTGVVIGIVLFFAVVLFAFDYLLHFLNGLLT